MDPRVVLRCSCSSQILLASRLRSPLPGGDMPRGSNLVPVVIVILGLLLPPERGLPSREAQILKSLVLLVCLSVRILHEIYRIAYGPAPHASTRHLFSECPKRVPQLLSFKPSVELFSGTFFFIIFYFWTKNIRMLWWTPEQYWDTDIPRIFVGFSIRKFPFRGDMPRGSNLVWSQHDIVAPAKLQQ